MSAPSDTPQLDPTGEPLDDTGEIQVDRPVRRALTTFGYALASLADIGLLVVGSALMALSAAILLDGFNVVPMDLTDSTGAMFGSALVIAVFGGFSLGVAFEGPIGHGALASLGDAIQLTVARAVAAFLVGLGITALGSFIAGYTDELPYPFELGAEVVQRTGRVGMIFAPFVAVPLTFLLRWRFPDRKWMEELELPIIFLIWIGAAMVSVVDFL